ncbi:MAG TPA: ribonuclease III [Byssovorax sp.]|jgi:ribonuclease-3
MLSEALSARLGPVADLAHLEEALTHPSFSNEQRGSRRADNQRLEFLGDAVLGLLVSELLMTRFPAAQEGELSRMRSLLVNTDALAAWARRVELGAALRLGRGADAAGERDRDNVLADAVEALMGAVYLDRGAAVARDLAADVVELPLSKLEAGQAAGRDPKSELQERVQAEGGASPRYRVVGSEGPDHQRVFIVVVEVAGVVLGEGRGRSKKLAEQAAARSAIGAEQPGHPFFDSSEPSAVSSSEGSAPRRVEDASAIIEVAVVSSGSVVSSGVAATGPATSAPSTLASASLVEDDSRAASGAEDAPAVAAWPELRARRASKRKRST